MTDQLDALRSNVVAAVQQELTRYNEVVSAEIRRLRNEIAAERTARARTEEQLLALVPLVERSQGGTGALLQDVEQTVEARLAEHAAAAKRRQDELEARVGRIADQTNMGLAAAVESAVQPIVKQLEYRQEQLETNVSNIDGSVRRFDDQASKMVAHMNVVSQATEARLDELSGQMSVELDGRLAALTTRMDDVSAQASRQQAEVSNIVGSRVDQAEARANERLLATEARINEGLGQRIADVDAYVGRVSAGLDESVALLSDRIADTQSRFTAVDAALAAMSETIASVDLGVIAEMKDRMAGLAGEVELIRIETERFEATIGGTVDKVNLRLVEVETQMQEQHMDVETAVQLERLEEVERALLVLDPTQFVRKADLNGAATAHSTQYSAPDTFSPPVDAQR
jgi:ribosome maturation factor RimP